MIARVRAKYRLMLHTHLSQYLLPIVPRGDLTAIGGLDGGVYGRFHIPLSALPGTVCYCAGVGEDTSFEADLIARTGCTVHLFDPTPRSIAYVEKHGPHGPQLRFQPIGLWSEDTTLRFIAPDNPANVSHSILDPNHNKPHFDAPCRRVSSLMRELGHRELGLLKMNIEGAELAVIDSLIEDGIRPRVILTTIDHPSYREGLRHLRRLIDFGYALCHVEGRAYTLTRQELARKSTTSALEPATCTA